MHIALLGGGGYVGSVFNGEIKRRGHSLAVIDRHTCNIYSTNELVGKLKELAPDALINCAGFTGKPNVDACEFQKSACLAGNAVLPGVIAEACEAVGIAWGNVSSGCIFTGRRSDGKGFTENDPPNFSFRQNNCSFYSGTKALGEEILAGAKRCYQWRLRIPFSNLDSSRNYLSKVLRYDTLLEAENSLSQLDEFVAGALDCFERNLPFGTYNLTNPGSVTTRQVVELIQESGILDKPRAFKFFTSDEDFMSRAAKAPRSNCVLDSQKAIAAGLRLSPVVDAIRRALKDWQKEETKGTKQ